MQVRPIHLGSLFALFVFLAAPAHAQSPSQQQTLQQYVADLQSNPGDNALRQKIIALAQSMNPPPAVPSDAYELVGRAAYAIKNASTDADFLAAADAYGKALQLAPWVADYYFNQGVAYEKAKHLDEAIAAFNWYLMAAPNAKDANEVRERIGGLKYAKEQYARDQQQQREQEERARAEQEQRAAPVKLWNELKAKYEGATYRYLYCDASSRALYACNEEEMQGSNWRPMDSANCPKLVEASFPSDETIVITSRMTCSSQGGGVLLRGTIKSGDMAEIAWVDGNGGSVWVSAKNGLDHIRFSTDWGNKYWGSIPATPGRPMDESQYNAMTRYQYYYLEKR